MTTMNAPTTLAARNLGMDAEVFEQFAQQLQRYVRERLIPAEPQVIAEDRVPAEILAEMREMGLFGLSVPEEYGGAGLNMTQYARVVNIMSYAAPAYRSIFSINVGMFASALKNGATEAQRAEWVGAKNQETWRAISEAARNQASPPPPLPGAR
jgi:acyl-CoA dehydrogenase